MKNDNQFDSIQLISQENSSIRHYTQVIQLNIHHFNIVNEIKGPEAYLDMINILKSMEENDTAIISLNTPGGELDTAIQIISAIKQCQGTVVTALEGNVCSAGTLIFLSGDKFLVNKHCTFMIHNYSQWVGGKGNEIHLQVSYYKEYFRKLANDIYGGFLTNDEIEAVLSGKDIWMDSDEVLRRLKENIVLFNDDIVEIEDDVPSPTPIPVKKSRTSKKIIKKKK